MGEKKRRGIAREKEGKLKAQRAGKGRKVDMWKGEKEERKWRGE